MILLAAAAATASSNPWVIIGAALGGAAIGGLLAIWNGYRGDNRKDTLEQRLLDQTEVREDRKVVGTAATRFLSEARTHLHAYEAQYYAVIGPDGEPVKYELESKHAGPNRPDFKPVYEAYWDLVLKSPNDVSDAARHLWEAVRAYDQLFTIVGLYPAPLSAAKWAEMRERHERGRSTLIRAFKKEFAYDNSSTT